MPNSILTKLDQAELFQSAVRASASDDSASSIACLKEATSRPDATAHAHYLLGAEYAQIRLYERAVGAMENALALDPSLSIARLQLGMLWLAHGVADRAQAVLAPLADLPGADPLGHFGAGLCDLIADRPAQAAIRLEHGIILNTANQPLNGDVRRILAEIARLLAPGSDMPLAQSPDPAAAADDSQHILLSAYTGRTNH